MKSDYSAGFERFWKLYPSTKCKYAAWLVWKRRVKPLFEQDVIDAVKAQVEARMFSDDDDYVAHARTWLHQQRWEDEIVPRASRAGYAAPKKGKYDGLY